MTDRETPHGNGEIPTPYGNVKMTGPYQALQWVVENVPGARRWSLFHLPRGQTEPCEDCDAYGCTMNCSGPITPERPTAPPVTPPKRKGR